MRRPLLLVAIVPAVLLAGCGSTSVQVDRLADTDALAGEQIVILLSRYSREGTEVNELGSAEAGFEWCVRAEMQGVNDGLVFLAPADFRRMGSVDMAAPPDALLRSLGEPGTAMRLAEAKVRYLVLLEGTYATSGSKWSVDGTRDGIAVGKEWEQSSWLRATILDLKRARIAGSIRAYSTGKEGAGVAVVLIIPVPFYFTTMPESRACSALGKELARFISG